MKNNIYMMIIALGVMLFTLQSCDKDEITTPIKTSESFEKSGSSKSSLANYYCGNDYYLAYTEDLISNVVSPSPDAGLLTYLNSISGSTISNLGLSANQTATHSTHYDRNNNGVIDATDISWFGASQINNPDLDDWDYIACYSSGWGVEYVSTSMILHGTYYFVDHTYPNNIYNSTLIRGYYDDIGSDYCDGEFNSFTITVSMKSPTAKQRLTFVRIP